MTNTDNLNHSELELQKTFDLEGFAERLNSLLDRRPDLFKERNHGRGRVLEEISGIQEGSWSNWLGGKTLPPQARLEVGVTAIARKMNVAHKAKHLVGWILLGPEVVADPLDNNLQQLILGKLDHLDRSLLEDAVQKGMETLGVQRDSFTRQQYNALFDALIVEKISRQDFDPVTNKMDGISVIRIIATVIKEY